MSQRICLHYLLFLLPPPPIYANVFQHFMRRLWLPTMEHIKIMRFPDQISPWLPWRRHCVMFSRKEHEHRGVCDKWVGNGRCFQHQLYQAMIPVGTIALLELLSAASWSKQGFPSPTNIRWCSKGSEHSQQMEGHKIKHGEFLLHFGWFFSQWEEFSP